MSRRIDHTPTTQAQHARDATLRKMASRTGGANTAAPPDGHVDAPGGGDSPGHLTYDHGYDTSVVQFSEGELQGREPGRRVAAQ